MPDAIRPFLRYDQRPLLTLSCLDVSTLHLPEPGVISVDYYDTIAYPEHIAVVDDDIIVSGYDGATRDRATRAHCMDPSIFRDYYLHTDLPVRDMKTVQNKLMIFPHAHYVYLGDQYIDLENNTGTVICETPTGFVVLCATGTMRRNEYIRGVLAFYENGICTHTVQTPYLWKTMTWVGEGEVAFAATRLLQGIAEVTLLSIDGEVIRVLFEDIHPFDHMGLSVLYDPVWQEYLVSGDKKIMAFSLRNHSVVSRVVYEYDKTNNSYYLHALTWKKERTLLVTIRNKSFLAQIQMK